MLPIENVTQIVIGTVQVIIAGMLVPLMLQIVKLNERLKSLTAGLEDLGKSQKKNEDKIESLSGRYSEVDKRLALIERP